MRIKPSRRSMSAPRRQQGVALYVALIMLLLLTLLGLAALQVTAMQERMTGNYRTFNLAFNRAEQTLRQAEFDIQQTIATVGPFGVDTDPSIQCVNGDITGLNDLRTWADNREPTSAATSRVANITNCSGVPSSVKDDNSADLPPQNFLIFAANTDRDSNASSVVVLEATYTERPGAN
jgi:type IV pilus assembly protein PilX